MSDDALPIAVSFNVTVALAPWIDPLAYVHTIVGIAKNDNLEELGAITLTLVSSTEAENRGLSILDVCDSDSGMLEAIYSTLIGADGERFEELDIEPTWCNLLVVDSITIHEASETSSLRRQLIETAIALFCPSGLIVAEEEALALTIDDWRQLGFRRITDSRFVFRDQLRTNPYNKQTRQIVDEGTYVCPGCGEVIVVPVDLTQGAGQEYVEDCPVCCRANRIHVDIDDMGYATVWVEPELNDE